MGEAIPIEPPVIDPAETYRVFVDAWTAGTGDMFTCSGTYLGSFSNNVSGAALISFLNDPAEDPPSWGSTNRQCNDWYEMFSITGHPNTKQRVIAIVEVL